MLNNKEMAEKIEKINSVVTAYVYKNMNDDFKFNMSSPTGSRAAFKTAGGSKVTFTSYRDFLERFVFVETEGQVNDKPFEFNFCSSMSDYGTGTIFIGRYGIAFWDVGDDEKTPIIKPFRNILGRKWYIKSERFASEVIEKILPLIEQFSKDVETITPDEETKAYLKPQDNPSDEASAQGINVKDEIEYLECLKNEATNMDMFLKFGKSEGIIERECSECGYKEAVIHSHFCASDNSVEVETVEEKVSSGRTL